MNDLPASEQIDAIIRMRGDWRGQVLANLRAVINGAVPDVAEEVKWRKPSRPEGVPVWSSQGIVCVADTLKMAVRLTFTKGAQIDDPKGLFNARLDSRTMRAIDVHEGGKIDKVGLKAIIRDAVRLNGR